MPVPGLGGRLLLLAAAFVSAVALLLVAAYVSVVALCFLSLTIHPRLRVILIMLLVLLE
jgi:hypothetical protein